MHIKLTVPLHVCILYPVSCTPNRPTDNLFPLLKPSSLEGALFHHLQVRYSDLNPYQLYTTILASGAVDAYNLRSRQRFESQVGHPLASRAE